jgi:hypothetical protein
VLEAARYAGYAVGPALAGAIVALGGERLALLVDAATFLAIAAAAAAMRARRPPAESPTPARTRDGGVHLWRDPVLRVILLVNVAALLFISTSITIEVFYVKEVLGGGDAAYAAVVAVWMAAMVAGATGLAPRLPQRCAATVALLALAVQGAGHGGADGVGDPPRRIRRLRGGGPRARRQEHAGAARHPATRSEPSARPGIRRLQRRQERRRARGPGRRRTGRVRHRASVRAADRRAGPGRAGGRRARRYPMESTISS